MASETTPERDENEHKSLKYSLLGPSLTKSGQDSVDQSKVCDDQNMFAVSLTLLPGFRDHLQCFEGVQILQSRGGKRQDLDRED